MTHEREVEVVFVPQEDGGYYAYAPISPGLCTQGESINEAVENVKEAVTLLIDGSRDDGQSIAPSTEMNDR